MLKKISIIVGTRPEAIKMSPLILKLKERGDVLVSVCTTGQHTDIVDSILKTFDITADENFSIMTRISGLNKMGGLLMDRFDDYFKYFKPDVVVVQGDTISVLTGALAAFNLQIPIAHVEAGLRTRDLTSPWPEEGFRCMVTQISKFHFAPTKESADNIRRSDAASKDIHVTGNTVIDALHMAVDLIDSKKKKVSLPENILSNDYKKTVLITGHRRENFGEGLSNLCNAIGQLSRLYPEVEFIFPVHLNPTVQSQVKDHFNSKTYKNIKLIEPLPYLEFVYLMKKSYFIITDSGGIQEEAPSLGKPVLVTRTTTERPEGVSAGTVKLVGIKCEDIVNEARNILDDDVYYKTISDAKNPYGDGDAAEKIIKILLK